MIVVLAQFARVSTVTLFLVFSMIESGSRAALVNGGFESGNFSGWTTYNDPNGKAFGDPGGAGLPRVSLFDTTGNGESMAAHFNAARTGGAVVNQGGGIFQSVFLNSGELQIMLDVAVRSPSNNAQGGLIQLLFDGIVVDQLDVGFIGVDQIIRDKFSATIPVLSAGSHEIRLSVQRRFGETSGTESTPSQYADNFAISGTAVPVPEPTAAALFAAFATFAFVREGRQKRRRMTHAN